MFVTSSEVICVGGKAEQARDTVLSSGKIFACSTRGGDISAGKSIHGGPETNKFMHGKPCLRSPLLVQKTAPRHRLVNLEKLHICKQYGSSLTCVSLLLLIQTIHKCLVLRGCSWRGYGLVPPENLLLVKVQAEYSTVLISFSPSLSFWAVGQTTGSGNVWTNPMEVAA